MPSNPTRPSTDSNNAKGNATYAKKDDSKFISVPKSTAESGATFSTVHSEASQGNRATNMGKPTTEGQLPAAQQASVANNNTTVGGVNRKKQKRRQKQAARLAVEEKLPHDGFGGNGHPHVGHLNHHGSPRHPDYVDEFGEPVEHYDAADGDDPYYSDEDEQLYPGPYDPGNLPANGHAETAYLDDDGLSNKKSKKKRKAKAPAASHHGLQSDPLSPPNHFTSNAPPPPPPPPSLSAAAPRSAHSMSRDRIWNTSTQEERERIKEFWLSLNEEDRRSLVKVEKEAVLRKMKEQQKHSCSCTVCGRKRTAIEEELEVLYDAYYEELEQYANHQQGLEVGAPMMPPPRRYGPTRNMHPSERLPPGIGQGRLSKGRIRELPDDDDGEEDYSDEDDEDVEYSDDSADAASRGPAADFFNFGNSLTVQGGILTVADDLLKNDGKKFIEMMEQLAERRLQREEEAQYAAAGFAHASMNVPGQHSHAGHNHPPLAEDEEYDEEEDEEYDSQEDEEYDEEEMDAMTEEQRMEEGRRMFQIFAARMFEQRVLTAYREKVAQERQKKLLEELEEESRLDVQREQKKAKEAQKKKDKKRLQKLAKDEERARKEAEKAAEEAAARALEEQKAEELRQKKEEQRRKKEAERKAQEEERLRKEAERQKKLQEERERQAELERKHREQKEREKKKKEEAKRKEKEEREAKERASKERKDREEKERKEKEAKARARAERAEHEAKERARKQELAAQLQQATVQHQPAVHPPLSTNPTLKRPAQAPPLPTPTAPPGLQPTANIPKSLQSPHLHVATPTIPKATSPARSHQTVSQQGSVSSSPKTPNILTGKVPSASPSNASQRSSPGPIGAPRKSVSQQSSTPIPQATNTFPATVAPPPPVPLVSHPGFPSRSNAIHNNIPTQQTSNIPALAHRGPIGNDPHLYAHQQPPIGSQFRAFQTTNILPGQTMPRPTAQARAVFTEGTSSLQQQTPQPSMGAPPPPGQVYGISRDSMPTHSHSRQQSLDTPSLDSLSIFPLTQPISRPAPIQRPSSVAPQRADENHRHTHSDVDDLSNHLGSSALLDDNDEPFPSDTSLGRRASLAPLPPAPGPTRSRFSFASMYQQGNQGKSDGLGIGGPAVGANTWALPQVPFGGGPSLPRTSTWTPNPGAGWSNTSNAFGIIGTPGRPTLSRPVSIRLLIVQACKQLSAAKKNGDDFHDLAVLLRQVELLRPANEPPIMMRELLEICETEGDAHNGGGYFTIKNEPASHAGLPGRPSSTSTTTLVKYEAGGNVPRSARGSIGSPVSPFVYC